MSPANNPIIMGWIAKGAIGVIGTMAGFAMLHLYGETNEAVKTNGHQDTQIAVLETRYKHIDEKLEKQQAILTQQSKTVHKIDKNLGYLINLKENE